MSNIALQGVHVRAKHLKRSIGGQGDARVIPIHTLAFFLDELRDKYTTL